MCRETHTHTAFTWTNLTSRLVLVSFRRHTSRFRIDASKWTTTRSLCSARLAPLGHTTKRLLSSAASTAINPHDGNILTLESQNPFCLLAGGQLAPATSFPYGALVTEQLPRSQLQLTATGKLSPRQTSSASKVTLFGFSLQEQECVYQYLYLPRCGTRYGSESQSPFRHLFWHPHHIGPPLQPAQNPNDPRQSYLHRPVSCCLPDSG